MFLEVSNVEPSRERVDAISLNHVVEVTVFALFHKIFQPLQHHVTQPNRST